MKHTPIEPHKGVCNCCKPMGRVLDKDKWLDVGFGTVTFIIEYPSGSSLFREYVGGLSDSEDQVTMVKDLEEEYGERMAKAECTTLFFDTPLHDETYEYNKEDGEWYLIAQGMGFA